MSGDMDKERQQYRRFTFALCLSVKVMYDLNTQNFCIADTERHVMTTPWTEYVDPAEHGFTIGVNFERAPALAINETPTQTLQSRYAPNPQHQIVTWRRREENVAVVPFAISLQPWSGEGRPQLSIHPIGVLHLYATGLITPDTMALLLNRTPVRRHALRLDESNPIVNMLGVAEAVLLITTAADIVVGTEVF